MRRRSAAPESPALEAQASDERDAMVERLRGAGASERTLHAVGRVPRHRLIPQFWSHRAGVGLVDHQRVGIDRGALRALYDERMAVGMQDPKVLGGPITSTASAPQLLVSQADNLALEAGMSVLEIGTGPGYFAALLAELVGPTGRVVTVDIDEEIATEARRRLEESGYATVDVVIGDAHSVVQGAGPFDRVVASVGCADVAPLWLSELTPQGRALIPIAHGAFDPSVHLDATGVGGVAFWSGYVPIQGAQAGAAPWPHRRRSAGVDGDTPLPEEFCKAVSVAGPCDLSLWVALCDDRANTRGLGDGAGSAAFIDSDQLKVMWGGPAGPELSESLIEHVRAWIAAGVPSISDYVIGFKSRREDGPYLPGPPEGNPLSWTISRRDHDEHVTLPAAGLPT